jgi:hypothetical protein
VKLNNEYAMRIIDFVITTFREVATAIIDNTNATETASIATIRSVDNNADGPLFFVDRDVSLELQHSNSLENIKRSDSFLAEALILIESGNELTSAISRISVSDVHSFDLYSHLT